ncbi:hypothetical protein BH23BAC1_BH23BAC1_11750 [soil metagenome]
MQFNNDGFSQSKIQELREEMKRLNKLFIINENEENSDEYVNFFFIGNYEEKEVVYDAVIYTLRLHHSSEVYEIAEHRAAKRFPNYKKINYQEDENGDLAALDFLEEEIGLYMAEVIMELEEEEAVKVQEHVEVDPYLDFGIGLDIGLNVEIISSHVIENFIRNYNSGTLKLDKTLYSFQLEENEEFNS